MSKKLKLHNLSAELMHFLKFVSIQCDWFTVYICIPVRTRL